MSYAEEMETLLNQTVEERQEIYKKYKHLIKPGLDGNPSELIAEIKKLNRKFIEKADELKAKHNK